MNRLVKGFGKWHTALLASCTTILVACEPASPTRPSAPTATAEVLRGAPSALTAYAREAVSVDGEPSFLTDATPGEAIPSEYVVQAKIRSQSTSMELSCGGKSCSIAAQAQHFGAWHGTRTNMTYEVWNADNGTRLGGWSNSHTTGAQEGCAQWAYMEMGGRFCATPRHQHPMRQASVPTLACEVSGQASTVHEAWYGKRFSGGASTGAISWDIEIATWGNNAENSNDNKDRPNNCNTCEDGTRDSSGECTSPSSQLVFNTGGNQTQSGDYWISCWWVTISKSDDGGRTWRVVEVIDLGCYRIG